MRAAEPPTRVARRCRVRVGSRVRSARLDCARRRRLETPEQLDARPGAADRRGWREDVAPPSSSATIELGAARSKRRRRRSGPCVIRTSAALVQTALTAPAARAQSNTARSCAVSQRPSTRTTAARRIRPATSAHRAAAASRPAYRERRRLQRRMSTKAAARLEYACDAGSLRLELERTARAHSRYRRGRVHRIPHRRPLSGSRARRARARFAVGTRRRPSRERSRAAFRSSTWTSAMKRRPDFRRVQAGDRQPSRRAALRRDLVARSRLRRRGQRARLAQRAQHRVKAGVERSSSRRAARRSASPSISRSPTTPQHPTSPYGITKMVAEHYLRFYQDERGSTSRRCVTETCTVRARIPTAKPA